MERPKIIVTLEGRPGDERREKVFIRLESPLPVSAKKMKEHLRLGSDEITSMFLRGSTVKLASDVRGAWELQYGNYVHWQTEPSESIMNDVRKTVTLIAEKLDSYTAAISYREFKRMVFKV